MGQALLHHVDLELGILVGPLRRPLRLGEEVLQMLDVGKLEFEFDRLHVGDRIDLPGDMDHVGILEAADHLKDGVDLTDVGEELVAEALPFARPLHDPRNVDELQSGRNHLLRRDELRDPGQPLVGHAHHAFVGLDRAKGVVGALRRLRHRQGVEEGALADVGETDDACFHGCGENPGDGAGGEGEQRPAGRARRPSAVVSSIMPDPPRRSQGSREEPRDAGNWATEPPPVCRRSRQTPYNGLGWGAASSVAPV